MRTWQEDLKIGAFLVLGILAAASVPALPLVKAHVLYGDWRCAFAECRIEVEPLKKGEREHPW